VGLTAEMMQQLRFGPILFREECIFKKEIRLGDTVSINLVLAKSRKDYSRWSIRHEILKNGETISAVLSVDGAWIDIEKRKLTVPLGLVADVFSQMPRAIDFHWMD
jgi:acyl-CoA thioester hydrolase